jgi:prepilin-type N-terminal cleavage/methylation domain-containing protein
MKSERGFTLVEMMISAGIGGTILCSIVLGSAAMQRVFAASDDYFKATSDQTRIIDYIVRDLRRAKSGSVSNSGQTLTVLLQDYIDPATTKPRMPTIATTRPSFGQAGASVTYRGSTNDSYSVSYSMSGQSCVRQQTIVRSGTTTSTQARISHYVENFQLVDANPTGGSSNFLFGATGQPNTVKTTVKFTPKFNLQALQSAIDGTAGYSSTRLRNAP